MNRRELIGLLAIIVFLGWRGVADAQENAATMRPSAGDDHPALAHRDTRYRLCASDAIALTFPLTPEFDQTVNIQPDGFGSLAGRETCIWKG